ncbi:SusC/RagA family TonB-linked outer membrane protein [Larkinella terrae]|uniref:SusC/RagA family TonB-linked outer membrane protein n=1 Tax=Larkinella terrae TaxID=2025311 RepID=A0A7K0ER76_9BACT|nr:TonB-dependent receptor [Larkinella terrae]MRS64061.1 SusC/RagA family TonB-linked outer membrane protein [Larkinella terrae]
MKTLPGDFCKFIVLCCWLILGHLAVAQAQSVKGIVTSGADNSPLPFVTVVVKGTQTGVTTDAAGKFTINAPADKTLVFSYIGYITKEVTPGNQTELSVVLEPDQKTLNEVVVVGYGSQSRETVTTSISKLDNKVLENIPYANAASALQGTLPGVRVQTTTGQPGAAPRVIIRGGTSINNPDGSSPLYIIDGVIRSDMNDINADDIETLQVLKDASSTSIYGARGANGVVIITTKKGKAGKMQITFRQNTTFSQLAKKYNMMSARDYVYFGRLGVLNSAKKIPERMSVLSIANSFGTGNDLTNRTYSTVQYLTPQNQYKLSEGWESIADPADPTKTLIFKNTDWQDVLFQTGISQNYYLGAMGGTEKGSYNLGVGYLKSQGIAINTDFRRFTFDLSGDLKIREKLKVNAFTNFTNSGNNQVFNDNQIFQRALALPPTAKLYFEDGTMSPGFNRSIGNPLYQLSRYTTDNHLYRLTLGGGLTWNILPGLTFEPSTSLYVIETNNNSFQKSYLNGPLAFIDSRVATGMRQTHWQQQVDAILSYNKSINQHGLDFMLGASYFDRKISALSATGQGASTDIIPTLNASATAVAVSSSITRQRIISFFGRANYNFAQKYLLSLNARYDGASNLGLNNKWGLFPGASVGWNIHNESFWKGLGLTGVVNILKLRSSYGVNGNLGQLGDFQAQGNYNVGARYDGTAAIQNTVIPNSNLKWEQTQTYDVGLDIGLFNGRVNLLVDYFNKRTDNLLTNLELPLETGFQSILTNYGSLQNRGFEVEISGTIIRTESGFNWNAGFNIATNQQKILKLPANGNERNRVGGVLVYDPETGKNEWRGGLQEGGRIGDYYAYKQIGIFATDEEAAAAPIDNIVPLASKVKFGGDVNWLDVDGNKQINSYDRVYLGNPYPTVTGGFTTAFAYKNFTLNARADFTLGHTIYNYTRALYNGQFVGENNASNDILRSWQKPGDQTDIARYYYADQQVQSNLFRQNSLYFEKGDFLAIREITLGYGFPSALTSKLGLSNLRLNVTANNLKYFTKYSGLNPEEGGQDNGRYPVPRNFIVGLNVSF